MNNAIEIHRSQDGSIPLKVKLPTLFFIIEFDESEFLRILSLFIVQYYR